MSKVESAPGSKHGSLLVALGAMLITQTVAVLIFLTVPVMATEIAPHFGVPAKDIGVFMSIVFGSAMMFSAASGSMIRRYGGIRANQIGMSFSAVCLLLALGGSMPLLFVAAALMGLGYSPNTPSGSHVLARVTPPAARALVFSVKQSGAPLGGVIAGFLIPALVVTVGWRGAILGSVTLALLSVAAIQPLRARLDDDREPDARIAFSSPWHAISLVLTNQAQRRLTVAAFFLTSIQAIVITFLMIILVEIVALEFTLAGSVFAAAQAAGAVMRITMGWISDRLLGARRTLVVLGVGSAISISLLLQLGPQSPLWLTIGLSVLVGALSFGWNGVFLAEVSKLAAPEDVGTAIGGSLFFLYGGIVFGPLAMALMIDLTGGYAVPIYGVAALTLLASVNLLRTSKPRCGEAGSAP